MAKIYEPTQEQQEGYQAWVASRPERVRKIAEKFQPWELYRLKTTGHRVTVYSFGENTDGTVTLTVNVAAQFNQLAFERQVFGIRPEDLEPCDLPAPEEPLGAALTQDEVRENIDMLRAFIHKPQQEH